MKHVKITMPRRALTLAAGLALTTVMYGQQVVVKGHVVDATGEPVIGATVRVDGQQGGAVTDFDGNFTINADAGKTITVDYIGYETFTGTVSSNMEIVLSEGNDQSLNEVVVIGYGVAKKTDLTGSVTALNPDSKNKGLVVNPQEMIQGKVAGVNVTSSGGAPGGGSTIRIRGGSSLNGSNDPLIVIDGVAMDNNGVKGLSNPLSLVNPQDIESFSVLKDASATAIYGSRGSNGVIIITTKKGRKGLSIAYNGSVNISTKKKTLDMMDGDEYRQYIGQKFGTDSKAYAALGNSNTNWQDEIMRTAVSHDHSLTVSGTTLNGYLPFRVNAGYTDQQGLLDTSDFKRYTASVNLSPTLLDDHLRLNVNVKGMWAKTRYADTGAISAATAFDPTQSVYDTSEAGKNFGGYFEWKADGSALGNPQYPYTKYSLATSNPVAMLQLKNDRAISRDLFVSGDVDYQVHGFEDLHIHATGGVDVAVGQQDSDVEPTSPLAFYYGSYGWDRILKRNIQGSVYALYTHDFKDKLSNHVDVMIGAEESKNWRKQRNRYFSYTDAWNGTRSNVYTDTGVDYDKDGKLDDYTFETENYLVSYFGRANWSLLDRYYLTGTFRRDGSSRFSEHWSNFPSFAFMWKAKDEKIFQSIDWLSDLKLRLGWGKTGQQAIDADYTYFATYNTNSGVGSYYDVVGDGTLARPNAINKNLKWETTTTYNIGVDWGLFNQRLTGSFDWYYRETTDLLNYTNFAVGTNFRNQYWANIGSLRNMGAEASIRWRAVESDDWRLTFDYNITYNSNKITELDGESSIVETGGISAGTGLTAQAHAVDQPASSFYVYQQAYDENGKALEGVVVDRNGDGQITSDDRYFYKNPTAPVTMGFSTRLEYKNWDFGFNLRASLGNYVFNDFQAGYANCSNEALYTNEMYLTNRPVSLISDNWQTYDVTSTLSDRWVQNASFLKMDNITVGYSFENLFKGGSYKGISGRVYGTVNNVFTITNYDGIDPEVFGGIDNNQYPRPISFILGLNLNF